MITKKFLDDMSYDVLGAAIEVHKELGPGLLESVYHECMKHELTLRGIDFESEVATPVNYKGLNLKTNLRLDLLVEGVLSIELKAVKEVTPIDKAQLLSYMKLLKSPKGLLINFNVINIFKQGQQSFVNDIYRNLSEQ